MEILIPVLDPNYNVVEHVEKLEVHQKGLLHLAFSVLIFNQKGEMLLQKRAAHKYHSPSLWTNACCGHPYPNEDIKVAASRRLQEEMNFSVALSFEYTFHYKARFANGLTENEVDHVFIGEYEGEISPNSEEVEDYKYVSIEEIKEGIKKSPENYTVWFREIMKKY